MCLKLQAQCLFKVSDHGEHLELSLFFARRLALTRTHKVRSQLGCNRRHQLTISFHPLIVTLMTMPA